MSNTSLNEFLFSTSEMSAVFSPAHQLRAMARFEWALTSALESSGKATPGSATVLEQFLDASFVDTPSLEQAARSSGNIAIPFVRQLTAAGQAINEPAARTLHLGATSQDVLDTALVLQIRDALPLLNSAMHRLESALVHPIRLHRHAILCGRTWLQPGPPTTLGLKLAGTLASLRRHRDRLHSAAPRVLVLQFGGAAGTLAALGREGLNVSGELARILGLREPELPWHTQRDSFVEIVQILAALCGTLAKFARDVSLLMQAEVAEVSEPNEAGRGGSSTMPHKHNPVACAAILAIHTRMPGLASTMLHAMTQEHERGLGGWQAEWETIPESFRLASAALSYAIELTEGLTVDPARMQSNLAATLGLPLAEAVSTALAPAIGRSTATTLLRRASDRAASEHRPLAAILKEMPEITAHLTANEIDRLLDPANYLGSAQQFIDRVLREDPAHGATPPTSEATHE